MAYKKLKYWFDKELAELLSEKIIKEYPAFDYGNFIKEVAEGTEHLELKDRVEFIADRLKEQLSKDYKQAVRILVNILGPENDKETGMFTEGYWVMPIAKYVEKYGLDYFGESMTAIEEITKRNTGEYCIRPFIKAYPNKTLEVMLKWSLSDKVHVRRLASEGVRPRLPWASKLTMFIEDPSPIFPILENLKDDDSRYVQKSVANNLNDTLKDNYEMGMALIHKWSKKAPENRKWVIKHALRNQLKQNNSEAVKLLTSL